MGGLKRKKQVVFIEAGIKSAKLCKNFTHNPNLLYW